MAFFNTLNKISISVNNYFKMKRIREDRFIWAKIWGYCGGCFLLFIIVVAKWDAHKKVKRMFSHAFPKDPRLKNL